MAQSLGAVVATSALAASGPVAFHFADRFAEKNIMYSIRADNNWGQGVVEGAISVEYLSQLLGAPIPEASGIVGRVWPEKHGRSFKYFFHIDEQSFTP